MTGEEKGSVAISSRSSHKMTGLKGVRGSYKGLQGVTRGYKGGNRGLQRVTRGYKRLQEVTRDYKG